MSDDKRDIIPEPYDPAPAKGSKRPTKRGQVQDIPGVNLKDQRAADRAGVLELGELGKEGWLRGARPTPTPMLLTTFRPGSSGGVRTGALPRGKVALFVSPGGVGKTGLLCQLALAVATGTRWLDTFDVEGGPQLVLLALGEEDADEIMRRLWDAAEALKIRSNGELLALAEENLRVLPLYGHDATILTYREEPRQGAEWPPREDEHVPRDLRPCPSDAAQSWMKQMEDAGEPALIIFDPLSRFLSGDENDNKIATQHITILEQFTKLPGKPTVLCAHHTNKGALADDATSSQASARGASAFVDGARWMAALTKREPLNGRPRCEFSVEKTNYTAPIDRLTLIRDGGAWRPCDEAKGELKDLKKPAKAPKEQASKATSEQAPKGAHPGRRAGDVDDAPSLQQLRGK